MAHGTPASLDEMPAYLRLVRGGRPPSDDLIAEMRHNYAAIGGRSPLTDITRAQRDALQERLGPGIPVAAGMRNWTPFIGEAIEALVAAGARRLIGIPLAPQFSTLSVRKYVDAARAALPDGIRFDPVESFHLHPLLIEAFAERLCTAQPEPDEHIVFTAHSLRTSARSSSSCRAAAREKFSSCRLASSATTRRFCTTSTSRLHGSRVRPERLSGEQSR